MGKKTSLMTDHQKKSFVHQSFFSIAYRYDLLNTLFSFGLDALWRRKAVRSIISKKAIYCLDLCAGTLTFSIEWLKRHPSPMAHVVALDFCHEMLLYGKQKKSIKSYMNKIDLICADGEQTSLSDATFDCAMVAFGIRNLTNPLKGLQELYRVLKPGGKVAILEFSRTNVLFFKEIYALYLHYIMPLAGKIFVGNGEAYSYLADSIDAFYAPSQVVSMMEKTGFKQVRAEPMTFSTVHLYTGQR